MALRQKKKKESGIKIEVKEKNAEGDIVIAGTLHDKEVNYLVQFAINALVAMGVEFDLKTRPDETEEIRMKAASGVVIH